VTYENVFTLRFGARFFFFFDSVFFGTAFFRRVPLDGVFFTPAFFADGSFEGAPIGRASVGAAS
jgi:hypothetical protein